MLEEYGPLETVVDTYDNDDTYNGIPVHEKYPHVVLRRYSRKTSPISSNGIDPTPYSRVVGHSNSDSPFVTKDGAAIKRTHISAMLEESLTDFSVPSGLTPLMDNAEARSLTEARNRLRNDNNMSLGTTVLESKKTAEMLADTGSRMAKAAKAFRQKLNLLPPGLRRKAELFGGAWLEGYYGWGSLARDAFDLNSMLNTQVKEPMIIGSSCTSRTSYETESQITAVLKRKVSCEGLVKVGYKAEIEDSVFRDLDRWGLSNPASIAWELVPYSFCLDWFMPVGNVLSSLTATAGLRFRSGYITTVTKTTKQYVYNNTNGFTDEVTLDPGNYTEFQLVMNRRRFLGFQPPALYANENPFTTTRIVNAIALISQLR